MEHSQLTAVVVLGLLAAAEPDCQVMVDRLLVQPLALLVQTTEPLAEAPIRKAQIAHQYRAAVVAAVVLTREPETSLPARHLALVAVVAAALKHPVVLFTTAARAAHLVT